ncbi:MAG: amidohydrolase [Deinococcales bacterium]
MKRVFINGNVITMVEGGARVQAIGSSGEVISILGTNEEVLAWAQDAEIIDLKGAIVIPGLIDSHSHISAGALWSASANCSTVTCSSIADVQHTLKAVADNTTKGDWVQGFGYDDTGLKDMRHLNRRDLDSVSTEHPIFVSHISGHLAYLNSLALELADINADTPNPAGGTIVKDETGEPTGLLLETAGFLARAKLPLPSREAFEEMVINMIAHYNRHGLTSTHDGAIGMAKGSDFMGICRELEKAHKLNIRIYGDLLPDMHAGADKLGMAKGFGSNYIRAGAVKYFQDGSIQGLTGALLDDYHNKAGWRGELIYPQTELEEKFLYHQQNGDQIVVHGNGDAAIESIITALEKAQAAHPREDCRHMLIHCQMAHDDHIERMKALGIVPSYFVNHVYYWGDRHKRLFIGPERASRIDPLGSSLRKGLLFSIHTDYPVTPIDPIHNMHIAVNRITREGQLLGEDERISALEALKTYTTHAAWCSFEEDRKGSLEVGKLADMTVLSEDILAVAPETIKDIKVLRTVVGGRSVYIA